LRKPSAAGSDEISAANGDGPARADTRTWAHARLGAAKRRAAATADMHPAGHTSTDVHAAATGVHPASHTATVHAASAAAVHPPAPSTTTAMSAGEGRCCGR
jgi:hypothetical protein